MYVDMSRSGPINSLWLRVPIYSASSWASIMSQDAAFYLDPLRDIYEVLPAKSQGICRSAKKHLRRSPYTLFSNFLSIFLEANALSSS